MTWMAATAVLISVCLWIDRTMRNGKPLDNRVAIGAVIVIAIGISGALCCAGWGFSWRRQGYAFPAEPGQWLIVILAVATAGYVVALMSSLGVFFLVSDDVFSFVWLLARFVLLIGLMGISVHAGRRSDTFAWQAFFYTLAAMLVAVWLIGALFPLGVMLLALLVGVANDWRRCSVRHWTHWLGISLFGMICLACGVLSQVPAAERSQVTGYFW